MAGPFPFHKQILADSTMLQSKWRDALRNVQSHGPELAQYVSSLETLIAIFNRERELLSKLIYAKNNQLRMFKFWQYSKQVKARLKAPKIEFLASTLQSTHLQLSYVPFSLFRTIYAFFSSLLKHFLIKYCN
jgi:hypothetical protein